MGRDKEIKLTLDTILEKEMDSKAVVISSFDGMPAIGKTTLAIRIAHTLSSRYPDGQLFIDCYGYTSGHAPLNKEQILDSLLFSLGIAVTRVPEKYEDKLSLWRLELSHKNVIIVFDNVKHESQVDELIPSSTNSLFIITSRNRLLIYDCYPITVDVLDTETAVLILNGGLPENNRVRYEMLSQLAQKYGNLPLALQIISHQIKGRSDKYIQRLISERYRFENLNAISDAVYQSFDISFEKLTHSDQLLFEVLGLFPGFGFDAPSCAAMVGVDTSKIYTSLDILYQQNLIKEVAEDRYVLHDLMRDFSREKYYSRNKDNQFPIIRLLQYYIECINHCNHILYPYNYSEEVTSDYSWKIDEIPVSQNDALKWLRIDLENILACLDVAKLFRWHILYFKLSYVLSPYILNALSGWRVIGIYQEMTSYEDLDQWMYAAIETNLAIAYHQVGNFDVAVSMFIAAEKKWRQLDNRYALAYALEKHSFALERLGNYPVALNIIEEALKYERELNNYSGIASALNNKGAIYWRMQDYPSAYKIFVEAIQIRQEIGDKYGVENSINNLAFTLLRLGDERAAREGFSKSLNLARQFHDYSSETVTLNNLGYTEIFADQPSKAITFAQDAFDIASKIGNEYQVARSYDVKGKAYLLLHDKSNAIYHLKCALNLFEKLNVPEADEVRSILSKLDDF